MTKTMSSDPRSRNLSILLDQCKPVWQQGLKPEDRGMHIPLRPVICSHINRWSHFRHMRLTRRHSFEPIQTITFSLTSLCFDVCHSCRRPIHELQSSQCQSLLTSSANQIVICPNCKAYASIPAKILCWSSLPMHGLKSIFISLYPYYLLSTAWTAKQPRQFLTISTAFQISKCPDCMNFSCTRPTEQTRQNMLTPSILLSF